jgi:arginine decarboxylase
MPPGAIRFAVMAKLSTCEHGRRISSSIGVAQPKDTAKWGYLSELHEFGLTKERSGELAEDLAASMLGTTLGIELDPESAWIEREQIYKASGLIVRTSNITQTATGKDGFWTTVVALAVFIS